MPHLTVATQRLSKGRGNREGTRETKNKVAAWGEWKVKKVGKVGNCDSNRYEKIICFEFSPFENERNRRKDREGINKKE